MRRFIILMSAPDEVDLTRFANDLNSHLKKYGCIGMLDEVINPLIIDDKDNNSISYG